MARKLKQFSRFRGEEHEFTARDLKLGVTDLQEKMPFTALTFQESEQLAEEILYKGQYRVLNISVLFIISMIIFGIVFMSVWHYYNRDQLWALYVVLGVVLGAISINVMGLKLYHMYRRINSRSG